MEVGKNVSYYSCLQVAHRVSAVAVCELQNFINKVGIILNLKSVCTRGMSRIPFGFCANVDDKGTSAG